MMDNIQRRRLIENEVIARTNNRKAGAAINAISNEIITVNFFCECSLAPCQRHIPMDVADYTKIHESHNRFMVTPGHDKSSVEFVKEKEPEYWVVEKYSMKV